MSVDSVKAFFKERNLNYKVLELDHLTSTVELAAKALNVEEGQIAKTLAFKLQNDEKLLVVVRGDARIDNKKFRQKFMKGKMLSPSEVELETGHPVGGVCPFGLSKNIPIYLDISLKAFTEIFPAAGAINAAVKIPTDELCNIVKAEWVDICKQ
ncbi:MAG: YbaK/EbsC family protein [Candidatus Fonsibacter sp.]|jgi:Cys-tRNA(Pro) deacylase|nr:YbaK/EbsC family protein [Pelagibacterales bacterium]